MIPDLFRPVPVPTSLETYVRRMLLARSDVEVDATIAVRPSGYMYLGWVLRGRWQGWQGEDPIYDTGRDSPLAFGGQITRPDVTLRMSGQFVLLNLEFTTQGTYELFGIDASRLNDCILSFEQLGLPAPNLPSSLILSEDAITAQIELLLEPYVKQPRPALPGITEAARLIESAGGNISIRDVASQSGISERSLRRGFKLASGITPKAFARCVQVNSVLAQMLAKSPQDLSDLASAHGFSDQSHMTRSFMQFLGSTPGAAEGGLEPTLRRFVGYSQAQ